MVDSKLTQCFYCGKPTRLATEEQAVKLNCTGIHFLEEGGRLIAIQNKGLRVGNQSVLKDVEYGLLVTVGANCDLYGCRIGNRTKVKHYVEIQGDVVIGQLCKVESFCFIPSGTRIGDRVFLGPHCVLTNDRNPRAVGSWKMNPVVIEDDVSVGANATVLPGVVLGRGCMVGAGAVVTRSVPPGMRVAGNPAREV